MVIILETQTSVKAVRSQGVILYIKFKESMDFAPRKGSSNK